MTESANRTASFAGSSRTLKQAVGAALAAVIATLLVGTAGASADTSTGFVLRITCGSETATIVSPTSPAAVGQDISSTRVFVLAVGALFAPERFPAGKVMLCDLENLTTGSSFEDLPFLVTGAP
jgi:N-methylhydantoinase B/oxoprolinase/acetone carboxylase alpha subunit